MTSVTLLLRQVHPKFIEDGRVTSQAFIPFPKDENKLSVYDGDQISAALSHEHYTQILGYDSDGVWAVTCIESHEIGLPTASDPQQDFPEHAVIDFSSHSPKAARKLAKQLRDLAVLRGRLHPPK